MLLPGSAIYIFGIIPPDTDSSLPTVDYSFSIDGQQVGQFTKGVNAEATQTTFVYNALLFSKEGISPGQHTFMIQNGQNGGQRSRILFDYLIYSQYVCDYSERTSAKNMASIEMMAPVHNPPPLPLRLLLQIM